MVLSPRRTPYRTSFQAPPLFSLSTPRAPAREPAPQVRGCPGGAPSQPSGGSSKEASIPEADPPARDSFPAPGDRSAPGPRRPATSPPRRAPRPRRTDHGADHPVNDVQFPSTPWEPACRQTRNPASAGASPSQRERRMHSCPTDVNANGPQPRPSKKFLRQSGRASSKQGPNWSLIWRERWPL